MMKVNKEVTPARLRAAAQAYVERTRPDGPQEVVIFDGANRSWESANETIPVRRSIGHLIMRCAQYPEFLAARRMLRNEQERRGHGPRYDSFDDFVDNLRRQLDEDTYRFAMANTGDTAEQVQRAINRLNSCIDVGDMRGALAYFRRLEAIDDGPELLIDGIIQRILEEAEADIQVNSVNSAPKKP